MLVGSKIKNIFIRVYWKKKYFQIRSNQNNNTCMWAATETCEYYKQYVIKNKVFFRDAD